MDYWPSTLGLRFCACHIFRRASYAVEEAWTMLQIIFCFSPDAFSKCNRTPILIIIIIFIFVLRKSLFCHWVREEVVWGNSWPPHFFPRDDDAKSEKFLNIVIYTDVSDSEKVDIFPYSSDSENIEVFPFPIRKTSELFPYFSDSEKLELFPTFSTFWWLHLYSLLQNRHVLLCGFLLFSL